jgi:hypothetical protein
MAGINNDNHPCLTKYSDLGPYPSKPDISDAEKRVLNSIITILIRRSEVLMLIPCEPPSSPAQSKRAMVKTPPYAISTHQAKPNDSGSATLQDDKPSDNDEEREGAIMPDPFGKLHVGHTSLVSYISSNQPSIHPCISEDMSAVQTQWCPSTFLEGLGECQSLTFSYPRCPSHLAQIHF